MRIKLKKSKNWLHNKKVIITGASSGIGKGLVEILTNEYSCQVLGIARTKEKLENIKNSLNNNLFIYEIFDVSNQESWANFANNLTSKNENYDILIQILDGMKGIEK